MHLSALFVILSISMSCQTTKNKEKASNSSPTEVGQNIHSSLGQEVKALFAQYQEDRKGETQSADLADLSSIVDDTAKAVADQDPEDIAAKVTSENTDQTVQECQIAPPTAQKVDDGTASIGTTTAIVGGSVMIGLAATLVISELIQEEYKLGRIGTSPVRFDGKYYYINENLSLKEKIKRLVIKDEAGNFIKASVQVEPGKNSAVYLRSDILETTHFPAILDSKGNFSDRFVDVSQKAPNLRVFDGKLVRSDSKGLPYITEELYESSLSAPEKTYVIVANGQVFKSVQGAENYFIRYTQSNPAYPYILVENKYRYVHHGFTAQPRILSLGDVPVEITSRGTPFIIREGQPILVNVDMSGEVREITAVNRLGNSVPVQIDVWTEQRFIPGPKPTIRDNVVIQDKGFGPKGEVIEVKQPEPVTLKTKLKQGGIRYGAPMAMFAAGIAGIVIGTTMGLTEDRKPQSAVEKLAAALGEKVISLQKKRAAAAAAEAAESLPK